jgi:hypothetical protein
MQSLHRRHEDWLCPKGMFICMCVCMYACMYVQRQDCLIVHMYVCMFVCMYVRSESPAKNKEQASRLRRNGTRTYIHTHIHTYMHESQMAALKTGAE